MLETRRLECFHLRLGRGRRQVGYLGKSCDSRKGLASGVILEPKDLLNRNELELQHLSRLTQAINAIPPAPWLLRVQTQFADVDNVVLGYIPEQPDVVTICDVVPHPAIFLVWRNETLVTFLAGPREVEGLAARSPAVDVPEVSPRSGRHHRNMLSWPLPSAGADMPRNQTRHDAALSPFAYRVGRGPYPRRGSDRAVG